MSPLGTGIRGCCLSQGAGASGTRTWHCQGLAGVGSGRFAAPTPIRVLVHPTACPRPHAHVPAPPSQAGAGTQQEGTRAGTGVPRGHPQPHQGWMRTKRGSRWQRFSQCPRTAAPGGSVPCSARTGDRGVTAGTRTPGHLRVPVPPRHRQHLFPRSEPPPCPPQGSPAVPCSCLLSPALPPVPMPPGPSRGCSPAAVGAGSSGGTGGGGGGGGHTRHPLRLQHPGWELLREQRVGEGWVCSPGRAGGARGQQTLGCSDSSSQTPTPSPWGWGGHGSIRLPHTPPPSTSPPPCPPSAPPACPHLSPSLRGVRSGSSCGMDLGSPVAWGKTGQDAEQRCGAVRGAMGCGDSLRLRDGGAP